MRLPKMAPKWAPLTCVVVIFLFLFDLSFGFKVDIIAGRSMAASKVTVSGSERHVITDEERTLFQLGDHDLKQKVGRYFGKVPKDAYVRSPTPWGDLYKRYSWPQVEVTVKPVKASIVSFNRKLIALKTQEFVNQSPVEGTYTVSVHDSVWNTVSSSWTRGQTVSVGQKISYGVGFLGSGAEGETSLGFEAASGQGGSNERRSTVGSTVTLQVKLKPGEKAMAQLKSYRSVMKVRVTYHAQLWGSVAVNYHPKYKNHHFWKLDINSVMGGNRGAVREYSETIDIGYYSDSTTSLLPHKMHKMCTNPVDSVRCGKIGLRRMLGSPGTLSKLKLRRKTNNSGVGKQNQQKGKRKQRRTINKRGKHNSGRKSEEGGMSKRNRAGGKKTQRGMRKQKRTNNIRGKRKRGRKSKKGGIAKRRRAGGKHGRKDKKRQSRTNSKGGKSNLRRKNKKHGMSKNRGAGRRKASNGKKNRKGKLKQN